MCGVRSVNMRDDCHHSPMMLEVVAYGTVLSFSSVSPSVFCQKVQLCLSCSASWNKLSMVMHDSEPECHTETSGAAIITTGQDNLQTWPHEAGRFYRLILPVEWYPSWKLHKLKTKQLRFRSFPSLTVLTVSVGIKQHWTFIHAIVRWCVCCVVIQKDVFIYHLPLFCSGSVAS